MSSSMASMSTMSTMTTSSMMSGSSSMSMGMGSSTMMMSGMPTATSMPDMMGMGMGPHGEMLASMMSMTFFSGTSTPLWTTQFTSNSKGEYAGACILLLILALVLRGMFATKSILEAHWHNRNMNRRYVTVTGKGTESQIIKSSSVASTATLSVNGIEEDVMMVHSQCSKIAPWRVSVDPLRALLTTAIITLGYLLMIAVMTMNVGFFLSILGGSFLGELIFGRYHASI